MFMFIAQISILELGYTTEVFHCQGSLVESFDKNKCLSNNYSLDDDGITNKYPTTAGSISPTTGNLFTDIFVNIKTFFSETLGLGYVYAIIKAPYSFLGMLNLPSSISFILGTFWYAISFFVIVSYMWGREN
jgi:hypothetical protein